MPTLWDNRYKNERALEKWLYGSQSLEGATRSWFVQQVRSWPEGSKFLDAGCGGGVTAHQLNQAQLLDGIQYVGADFSDCMLKLAKRKTVHSNVRWVQAPLEELDFGQEFDFILLRAVLAHILDPWPVLKAVARSLKKSGMLYVVFWNNPNSQWKVVTTQECGQFYDISHSETELLDIIEDCGLKLNQTLAVQESSKTSNYRHIWICGVDK